MALSLYMQYDSEWRPACDVCENADCIQLIADLPGMARESVKVGIEDGPRLVQQPLAIHRQRHAMGISIDQTSMRQGLQSGNLLADCGLPDLQAARCAGEASGIHHCHECLEEIDRDQIAHGHQVI